MEYGRATQDQSFYGAARRLGAVRAHSRTIAPALAALVGVLGACSSDAGTPAGAAPVTTPPTGAPGPMLGGAAGNMAIPTSPIGTGTAGSPSLPGATAGGPAMPGMGGMNATGTAGSGPDQTANNVLPCNVSQILAKSCQTCHGAKPIGGAPMPMVTYADLHKPAPTQPSMKVFELAKVRVHDEVRPMPPVGEMEPADLAVLDAWFAGGAIPGTPADANCQLPDPSKPTGGRDHTVGRLEPGPGETCYEFKVHGSTTSVDDSPYMVAPGEHYQQFYYDVPWPEGTVATSYATIGDNAAVLHHWLLFSTDERERHGFHKTVPLPTLIGTNPILLAGWAVGGPNLEAPEHVGFELPPPGKQLNVQWHFYNSTNAAQGDNSSIQICTVPIAMRENVGAVAWLGTEDLNGNVWFGGAGMPPHQESTFTSTCVPGRRGLAANESIHIIGFEPHMHRIGKRMTTTVNRPDGTSEKVFDEPFSFGNETHYFVDYELKPGETLTTSCTFNNTNDFGVPFGESSDTEMCYQFTFHYPAHTLANGAFSLLGVTDTCW